MDGSLVTMEGMFIFLLLQRMVAMSLWKVVCCLDFCYSNECYLVIKEGSLLSMFLLLQWMLALTLWKVDCC